MKKFSWIIGLSFFTLSTASAMAQSADEGVELPACLMLNEETLSEPVSFVWKNGRDTPVRLLFSYKDTDGLWRTDDTLIPAAGKKSVEILSRCIYWYGKRGKAIYTPKTEKNSTSDVSLNFEGKSVKSISLDLLGNEGKNFSFTLK